MFHTKNQRIAGGSRRTDALATLIANVLSWVMIPSFAWAAVTFVRTLLSIGQLASAQGSTMDSALIGSMSTVGLLIAVGFGAGYAFPRQRAWLYRLRSWHYGSSRPGHIAVANSGAVEPVYSQTGPRTAA